MTGYYPVKSLVLLCTGNWLLLIPHVDQGFTAHLADGNAGSAEDTARLTDEGPWIIVAGQSKGRK